MIHREIRFETESTSADAIQRAAYRVSDRLALELVTDGGVYRCAVDIEADNDDAADQVLAEFRTEVLDQVLRERIRRETTDVRNLILALAFSRTGLSDTE